MKKLKIALLSMVIGAASASAYAACGDSECGYISDTFICVVEGAGGSKHVCTGSMPCIIKC